MSKKAHRKRTEELWKKYLNQYDEAENKVSYISSIIPIRNDYNRRIDKIANRINKSLDKYDFIKRGLVTNKNKWFLLLEGYYRRSLVGMRQPEAYKKQIKGAARESNLVNESVMKDIQFVIEASDVLAERSLKEQVLTWLISYASNNDYPEITSKKQVQPPSNKDISFGPKTPVELKADLRKIIEAIPKGFFHDDGKIKHTSTAKYALDQEWFSKKWEYSDRHLGDLVKKVYEEMNCS